MLTLLLGRRSFYTYMLVLMSLLTLAIVLPMSMLVYQTSLDEAVSRQEFSFNYAVDSMKRTITSDQKLIDDQVERLSLSALSGLDEIKTWEERRTYLEKFGTALSNNPASRDFFVGYENGDYLLLSKPSATSLTRGAKIPANTVWFLIESTSDNSINRLHFLDKHYHIIATSDQTSIGAYDPRKRGWYTAAREAGAGNIVHIAPYKQWGTTEAYMSTVLVGKNGHSVVGQHQPFSYFDRLLTQAQQPDFVRSLLLDDKGEVVYLDPKFRESMTDANAEFLARKLKPIFYENNPLVKNVTGIKQVKIFRTEIKGQECLIYFSPVMDEQILMVFAVPMEPVRAVAYANISYLLYYLPCLLLIFPLVWWIARLSVKPLRGLTAEAQQINNFIFSDTPVQSSVIIEIDELATAINRAKNSLNNFVALGQAMGDEPYNTQRETQLLLESCRIVHGLGAAIYVKNGSEELIPRALCRNGMIRDCATMPRFNDLIPLLGENPDNQTIVAEIEESYWEQHLLGWGNFPGPNQLVSVPLFDHGHNVVGVMMLLLPYQEEEALYTQKRFIEAISGRIAAMLLTQQLIQEQQALIDSFIELIAGSIDSKSPYTGVHCTRVPMLTKKLAKVASERQEGIFATFNPTKEDWEAIRVASWLHDCGKITTPEYVLDKATKLETICDRIHEVRTRFEVLKRDAQLAEFTKELSSEQIEAALARVTPQWQQLDEEFAFVARCNSGDCFTSPEDIERLKQIGSRRWLRTLDRRLGLGHEELARMAPDSELPTEELLLSDRPEHIIPHSEFEADILARNQNLGVKVKVPENLYNRGELYNLAIPRGTLTEEERYKINDHVIQTLRILSALPFPKHLRAVPDIAAGHHERIDGRGYPRQHGRDGLTIPARIMAIADIFEALTACDRPYKRAKTISLSLKIMLSMAKEGHIDPDLYRLFIESDIWLEYAQSYLKPEQIDSVDKEALLAGLAA